MNNISRILNQRPLRAFTLTVCSGKGGTGKSTIAALLARTFAETDQRVALVDCDFGVGDVATMANLEIVDGSEDLLEGRRSVEETSRQVSPNLWLIGTKHGSQFVSKGNESSIQSAFEALEHSFDIVIFDTAAAIDGLTLQLISRSDRSIVVTTPRVSAIADSYVQLKQATELIAPPRVSLIVNQSMSETEGEQAMIKFIEMVEKFLGLPIDPLVALPTDPQLTHLADNQALYRPGSNMLQSVKNLHRAAKTIQEKEITKPRKALSLASHLPQAFDLKSVAAFDDREVTVHSYQE